MTNVHISLGNCTKRAFDKELRKIRMYGGRVTRQTSEAKTVAVKFALT